MKNEYYSNLGHVDLGSLDRVHGFLDQFFVNKHKLESNPTYAEIHTDIQLNLGNELICMKYGTRNLFYTVKGPVLAGLFDNWEYIQNWVESKVGNTVNKFPLFSCCNNHIFRHCDLKRGGSVNMGIMNVEDSVTCFWNNNKLIDYAQYKVGEAILANVRQEHSVIINDSPSKWNNRAILMWTTEQEYNDIINSN